MHVHHYHESRVVPMYRKRYGFWQFMKDFFLVCFTGGFWLIWIFCREMRGR